MKHDQEPLDERAVKRVLHAAEGTDLKAAVVVAATTGLRLRELLALHWSNVDTARGRIFVRSSFARRETAASKGGSQTVAAPPPRRKTTRARSLLRSTENPSCLAVARSAGRVRVR